jgi:hypothetical protein
MRRPVGEGPTLEVGVVGLVLTMFLYVSLLVHIRIGVVISTPLRGHGVKREHGSR